MDEMTARKDIRIKQLMDENEMLKKSIKSLIACKDFYEKIVLAICDDKDVDFEDFIEIYMDEDDLEQFLLVQKEVSNIGG